MPLSPGTKLGPYEIVAPIGAGGMGEVYRARDSRLNRQVAVKVLPTFFSSDPDRLRRFQQEAMAAAALNDPGILVVYDVLSGCPALVVLKETAQSLLASHRSPTAPLGGAPRQRKQ